MLKISVSFQPMVPLNRMSENPLYNRDTVEKFLQPITQLESIQLIYGAIVYRANEFINDNSNHSNEK